MPPEPIPAAAPDRIPPTTVRWRASLPPLPAALGEHAGLDIAFHPDAADPLAVPAFADLVAHLRAQQIVRALSARTNRVLAGTRVSVLGDGVLADAIADALTRLGARVTLATDSPAAALRARIRGRAVVGRDAVAAAPAEHLVATGEGHTPFDPAGIAATAIDASFLGGALVTSAAGEPIRAGVVRHGAGWIVASPSLWPEADATDLERRAADAFLLLSRLSADTAPSRDAADPASDAADLDARFAREVQV
ncbi:MAG: hypothetical protein NT132_12930 [Microbacterium sp.]|uniref:hypothetical protein n=1 Tax=Microbacterium sp. TaxID=51671 RepID=UPI002611C958|nr:hypothetical protein [Microbacterium sp.]MCX6503282.1 hypothetical protein [Microbacterium sp.]